MSSAADNASALLPSSRCASDQPGAIENHAFIVSSSYDMKSCVVAPDGEILVEATKTAPVVTAEISLDRKIYQHWLGDMSTRTWKERRGDLPHVQD